VKTQIEPSLRRLWPNAAVIAAIATRAILTESLSIHDGPVFELIEAHLQGGRPALYAYQTALAHLKVAH
jgi:hypothetical protein